MILKTCQCAFAALLGFAVIQAANAATPIGTAEEFVDQIVADPSGDYILTADLAFAKLAAIPAFSGTLDGDGHKITGLSSNLVNVLTGTIKGITIADSTYQHKRISFDKCDPFGFFAAKVCAGTIRDCTLSYCTLTQDKYSNDVGIGGIVGNIETNGGVVAGCKVVGCSIGSKFTQGSITYGGVVGRSFATEEGTAVVSDCQVLSGTNDEAIVKGYLVGGIVGGIAEHRHVRIERCLFDSTIDGGGNLGGILGPCNGGNTNKSVVDIVNCTNAADISVSCAAGGIVAGSYKGGLFRISGCVNFGNITTTANVTSLTASTGTGTGGIMGGHYGQSSKSGIIIDRSANYGTVSASTNCTGGLVAFFHKGSNSPVFIISNSVNHADVSSSYYTGGLVGYVSFVAGGSIFVNCCQSGNVSAAGTMPAGGLAGCVMGGAKISYRFCNVCQSGSVTAAGGGASSVFGSLSVGDKSWFKVYLDSMQIGGNATSMSGTVGIIGGSTTVSGTGALTVTVDDASAFANNTGTAYYDQTGAAKELTLNKLADKAMTDKTAVKALNAYASENGLVGWVQAAEWPDLELFSKQRSGMLFLIQ